MADSVSVTNWPESGGPHEIAYKLWRDISDHKGTMDERLVEYAKCLRATKLVGEFRVPAPTLR